MDASSAGACEGAKLACMSRAGGALEVAAAIGAAAGAVVAGDSVLATCVPDESAVAAGCAWLSEDAGVDVELSAVVAAGLEDVALSLEVAAVEAD